MTNIDTIYEAIRKHDQERILRLVRLDLSSRRTRYGLFREHDEECTHPIEGKTYENAIDATEAALELESLLDLNEKLQIKPVSGGK